MTLSLATTVVVLLDSAYASVTANADAGTRQLALAVEREIVRNVDLIDLSVQTVIDGVQQPSVMQLPPLIRNQFLFSRAAAARYIQQISVFDSHGRLFTNSLELEDSTALQALRLSDTNSLSHGFDNEVQVGHPYISGNGTRLVEFWRPIQAPTGQSSGLVTATVDLSYFSEILNSLNITPGTSIKLVLGDRTTLIDNQNPVDPTDLNRHTDDSRFLSHIARILRLTTDHDLRRNGQFPGRP